MSDFDTQINVGMNVEGVVTGTEKAKRSLKDLNTSARESGKSIDGMGDGGSKAADKVEAATRSMIGSIQRQTAALEAGDKSSRKYQESLAKMRGIDVGALKPYLDQLDAAKMKQDIAANSQKGLIGGFGGISTAALGAATAFVAVAAGVATMTKKVVDGLDALNDLKDATGASIENISAIEDVALRTGASFDVVSTSLIKLNQGLNNAKPGSDTENAINAIGLSVKDLKALDPAEAFRQVAVGLSGFADDANKARLTQELFGKSLKEVAPLLNDLAAAGSLVATVTAKEAEEAEKFNKELFNLSKTALDAARDMAGPLVSAINETIQLFREGAKEGKSFYSVLVDEQLRLLGLKDGPKEYAKRLNDISRELESGNIHQTKRNALLREQAAIQAKFSATPVTSYEETELARLARAPKPTVGNLPDQAAIKAAAAASAKALAELNKELAAQTKLLAENAGLTGTFANDWDRLAAIYKKGGISLEQLSEAQAKLLADQPAIKAAKDAEVKAAELIEKANKAAFESRLKHVESLGSGLDKLQEEVNKQAEYNDRLGLTKEAIAELDAVKLELQATDLDSIAIKKLDRDLDEEQYDLYKKQAAELRNLARLKRVGGEKEAALEVVKATNEEWKRGWEETDRLARDVFTTWATDGSNAAQKIGDTLKKALLSAIYEATIKPIALQLYTSIAGNGGAGSALQAASGAGNALSGGSSLLSGLFSAGGPIANGITNIGAAMINGPFSSLVGDLGASLVSNSAAIANAVPYVGAALVAVKALTSYTVKDNGSALVANLGGGSTVVANRQDYIQSSWRNGDQNNSDWSAASAETTAYFDTQVKAVTEAARAYGTALGLPVGDLDNFKQQIEVSLTGLNADQAKEAINKAVAGFGDAMVSANFGDAFAGIQREGETASAALVRMATDLTGVNAVFDSVGQSLLDVSVSGAATASSMVAAAGGLQNFQAQVQSLYTQLGSALASAQQDLADANRTAYELLEQSQQDVASAFGGSSGGGGGGGGGSDALVEAIKYLADVKLGIGQWLDKLNSTDAGGLDKPSQRDNAWAALQSQIVLARGGSRDALSGITGYADTYIDAINNTSATAEEARLATGRVRGQLAALPDQVSPEQFIVDAINANGGGGGAVATAVKSLNSHLTAELTVSARSEIVKLIEFVTDTDQLPYDLKQLALASADTMTKTVSFITGSKLSDENKQIALATSSDLTKTINYGLGLDIPEEYKRLALKTSDSIEKTIAFTAKNMLDPKQAELALMTDNSIVKTIEAAAKYQDADALKLAYAQSETIRKTIEASGGVLTEDQAKLLNNIYEYNKQVNLIVNLDEGALDAAETFLRERFNTLDINTIITADNGLDVLRDFVNSQLANGGINGISVANVHQAARAYGFTQQDIANAMGVSLAEVQSIFDRYNIPRFAVGTDFVPQDMLAVVHKGEQIVPAAYNPHNNQNNGTQSNAALVEEIRALRSDNQAQARSLVQLQQRMNKLLERWDGNGMPETRVVA